MEKIIEEFRKLFNNKLQNYIDCPRLMNKDISLLIGQHNVVTKEEHDNIWIQIYRTTTNIDGESLLDVVIGNLNQRIDEYDISFNEALEQLVNENNYNEVIISEIKKGE